MNCRLFYRFVFALYLLLFVCFLLQGIICVAQEEQTATDTVELFKFEKNKKPLKPDGSDGDTNIEVKNVGNIFFVATDEFIIALAKAKITKTPVGTSGAQQTDNLVAEYIKTKGDKWEEEVSNSEKWTAQLVTDDDTSPKIFSDKDGFAAVTKNQQIYIFAFKSTIAKEILDNPAGLKVAFVAGKVENGGAEDKKKITWKNEKFLKIPSDNDLKEKFTEEQKNNILSKTLNEGSAFLAGQDKTIFFFVKERSKYSPKKCNRFFSIRRKR